MNTELFKKIYETIAPDGVVDSSKFNMSEWEGCGTTRCVSVWAIYFASGGTSLLDDQRREVFDLADRYGVYTGHQWIDFEVLGAMVLGLTLDEAEVLFHTREADAVQFVRLAAQGNEAGALAVLDL